MDGTNTDKESFADSGDESGDSNTAFNLNEFEEETKRQNGGDNEERRVIRKSLIRFLSKNNFPTLEAISYEDDNDALLDDFGKCLSLLPPNRLSDSDSNDIEFFENIVEASNSAKTSAVQMKPFGLTKKQWQSCIDLFGKKQMTKLVRKTSRAVLRKQASLKENSLENAEKLSVEYDDDVPRDSATVS